MDVPFTRPINLIAQSRNCCAFAKRSPKNAVIHTESVRAYECDALSIQMPAALRGAASIDRRSRGHLVRVCQHRFTGRRAFMAAGA
jgi:hypothetical protein